MKIRQFYICYASNFCLKRFCHKHHQLYLTTLSLEAIKIQLTKKSLLLTLL